MNGERSWILIDAWIVCRALNLTAAAVRRRRRFKYCLGSAGRSDDNRDARIRYAIAGDRWKRREVWHRRRRVIDRHGEAGAASVRVASASDNSLTLPEERSGWTVARDRAARTGAVRRRSRVRNVSAARVNIAVYLNGRLRGQHAGRIHLIDCHIEAASWAGVARVVGCDASHLRSADREA